MFLTPAHKTNDAIPPDDEASEKELTIYVYSVNMYANVFCKPYLHLDIRPAGDSVGE